MRSNMMGWILAVALGAPIFGAAAASAVPRSPRAACRDSCKKARRACIRANKPGFVCHRERKSCYRACRRQHGGHR